MGGESGWHLDKRLSVTHFISTLLLVVGLFTWAGRMQESNNLLAQRLDAVERHHQMAIVHTNQRIDEVISRSAQEQAATRASLQRIEDKLDRVIERQ